MPASNAKWNVPNFTDVNHLLARTAYKAFSEDTNDSWTVGPGMWVSKKYKNDTANSGVAIQMEGCGKGYLQFADVDDAPRGIDTIKFNARLGQFVLFDDFNYYYGESMMSLSNYTFVTRAAFDLQKNGGFDGNASLSVVANYLPNKGCYEGRWEWIGTSIDKQPSNNKGQRLALYRWNVSSGKKKSELLAAWTNTSFNALSADKFGDKCMPFYISVSNGVNKTYVSVGVCSTGVNIDITPWPTSLGDKNWYIVGYCDASSSRLKSGSYGVLSANSAGVFGQPQYSPHCLMDKVSGQADNSGKVYTGESLNLYSLLTGDDHKHLVAKTAGFGTDDTEWNIHSGRMTTTNAVDSSSTSKRYPAIVAEPAAQKLSIELTPAGKDRWSEKWSTDLASFGGREFTVPFHTTENCGVRFKVGGDFDDMRTDVVVDSVRIAQWAGDDYSRTYMEGTYVTDWEDPYESESGMRKWVFTSAWITNTVSGKGASATTNGWMLLSAKRTNPGKPSSIRSPLMDGYRVSGRPRGIGLGMISYDWSNADSNACLLVQIATNNVGSTRLKQLDETEVDEARWTTVATNDFSKMGLDAAALRSGGTISTYIGLHGVKGMMRIVVDPALVRSVTNETDTSKFGSIRITNVICRDEPSLDSSAWWGWNLRTAGTAEAFKGDTQRMYLPDYSSDAGMSLALNHSATNDVDKLDADTYRQYIPFLQTPMFASNIVGEVSFLARRYDASGDQPAGVTLYGSVTGGTDAEWTAITNFVVTGDIFEAYSYKAPPGSNYAAFRLGVSGAEGVERSGKVVPPPYTSPVRVLLDEVLVSEAIRARMGFRNVGAFRSDMAGTGYVPNVPSKGEQPLCNEGWGVQCEVFPAQLGNEIDLTRAPRVVLHWFNGEEPWGFESWKGYTVAEGHHSAELAAAAETNMIYRSSYTSADAAVVPMSLVPGSVVQYMLEVRYYQKSGAPVTNYLLGGGTEAGFSAYNILDTVAPGWAWINEVNIHGTYDSNWKNSEDDCQFVEIAVPVEADISGWSVRFIGSEAYGGGGITTNTLGMFGTSDLPGMKPGNQGEASNMVFRVIASPKAKKSGTLKASDGTLDGVWDFSSDYTSTFSSDGEIFSLDPFGIQLVRASGVVEHEIVCIGTNYYGSIVGLEQYYAMSNVVKYLNEGLRGSEFFYAGADDQDRNAKGEFRSLGVFESSGETSNQWNSVMKRTPGRINEDQFIDPDKIPRPNGESILVVFSLDQSVGHIRQTVGDGIETNVTQTIFLRRGSELGTNVVYTVDPWYQLGSVTTNGQAAAYAETGTHTYRATVGVGATNNITVVASAKVDERLEKEFGLPEDSPYRPAVVDWLTRGVDVFGNKWSDAKSGTIKLAEFRALSGLVVTNLTLLDMYWLDMDPTSGGLALIGGMTSKPSGGPVVDEHVVAWDAGSSSLVLTNRRMTVYMMITNENAVAAAPADWVRRGPNDAYTHWTPYVLRGVEPLSNSLGYDPIRENWTSETFKITGMIMNGYTSPDRPENKVPLRQFVFNEHSFSADGYSKIEVIDPYSSMSYGYNSDWWRTWERESAAGKDLSDVMYFWTLDTRLPRIGVEQLKEDSWYGE